MADIEAQIHGVTEHKPANTTASPQSPQPPVIAAAQPTTPTNDRPHEDVQVPPSQIAGNPDPLRGEKYGDPSDGLWSIYLTEAEKQDKDVTESWKGDTEGILVFTGLFSATVAAFIIESYKLLSPNPSETTNALLTQISGQLVNISNGTPLASVVAGSGQPFKPTTSAVRVNVLWFLSLVLSLTCALSATLMQQWARRYQELAQHHGAPHRRARMRAYVFDGISKFGMARAVATMPTILHISVFLFFAGLIDFLSPIDKTVSYFTLGWVVAFALAYTVLTVLPNLYLNCPYATPLSGPTWRLSQFFVVVVLKATLRIEGLFHNSLLKLWSRVNQHVTAPGFERWREALKNQVKVHRQWLSEGLRKSIERNAKDAPSTVVTSALEWTLTALDEDKEIETFAAGVPGFFDSRTVPDATLAILPLMSEKSPTAILGSRLYDLLKTCIPGASPLNDEERKRRLRVCLKCLCYFGRAFNQSGASEPLPSYFPRTLASPDTFRHIQTEQDPIIHVMGLCFGALVVTKLAADVKSSTDSTVQIDDEQLACLSAILGTESPDVRLCLTQPGVIQLASMVSLALDDVASFVANTVPSDMLDVVRQTLDILSQTLPAEETTELPFNWSNTQTNIAGGKFDRIIASRLRNLLQMCISNSTLTDDVRRACLRMCLKSLWYYAKAYHQLGTSKQLPPYFLHAIATPEITRRIQQEEDLTSRMIGYCFEALVVTKLAADINSGTVRVGDQELACLSAILGAENHEIEIWLKLPGAIEHMGLFFLVLSEVGSMDTPAPTTSPYNPIPGTNTTPYYPVPSTNMSPYNPIPGTNMSPYNLVPGANMTPYYPVPGTTILPGTNMTPYGPIPGTNMTSYYPVPGVNTSPYPIPGANTSPLIPPYIPNHGDSTSPYPIPGATIPPSIPPYIPIHGNNTSPVYLIPGTSTYPTPGTIVSLYNPTPGTTVFTYPTPTPVFPIPRIGDGEKLDVWDVVQQTFSILFHTLPATTDTAHRAIKFSGGFGTILQNWLDDLLEMCTKVTPSGTSPLTNEVRITCLKSLWYHEIACHRLRAPRSLPALDLFPIHFIAPVIANRIITEEDPVFHVIGRCFVSLVVNRFAAKFDPSGDRELDSLSAIIGPDIRGAIHRPGNLKPGAVVQLVNVISLASSMLTSAIVNAVPSDVQHIVRQTISTLVQALPTELKVELHLDQADALTNIPESTSIKSLIVSLFRDLLETCTLRTLSEEVRAICLQTCLQSLWYLGKELQQLGNSQPSAPEFLDLASPEITHHIRTEKNEACRMKGRCVEALVISHLTARADSTVQISDGALGRISAILGTESLDSRLWLDRPGAIDLANMVSLLFSGIEALFSDSDTPSDLLDIIQRTLSILSPTLLDDLKAELNTSTDETSSYYPPIMYESNSRTCLKYLWHCARAYNRPEASAPLPSFVRVTLANPGITRRIHTARDTNARVTGRCFGALIVNKLVDDFKSRTSFSSGVYDAELACISSILGTEPGKILRWPHPSAVIKLLNVVSLMLGEIETLITSGQMPGGTTTSGWAMTVPVDMLNIVQQTISIITPDLVLGGAFACGDLPMDQVSLLREICSKIANAQPDNRFRSQTMVVLDQLQQMSKQLPTVERRMRRCKSSIFGPQLVRGRVNLATQPEYEVRRKRSKSI